mgnify:CR=1 FL=1
MAKTSPREAERSNVYYADLFPPARPLLLDAVKRGLARHEDWPGARPARGWGRESVLMAPKRYRMAASGRGFRPAAMADA